MPSHKWFPKTNRLELRKKYNFSRNIEVNFTAEADILLVRDHKK